VIADLWDQILHVVIDLNCLFDDDDSNIHENSEHVEGIEGNGVRGISCFDAVSEKIRKAELMGRLSGLSLVYSKQWSVASIKGGMSFT